MRKIKLRAWDEIGKKIVRWNQLVKYNLSNALINPDICGLQLMQYTGLKDKNGVEIYEGDICKVSGDEYYSNNYFITAEDWEMMMIVKMQDYSYTFIDMEDKYISITFSEINEFDIEVIGNIHESEVK